MSGPVLIALQAYSAALMQAGLSPLERNCTLGLVSASCGYTLASNKTAWPLELPSLLSLLTSQRGQWRQFALMHVSSPGVGALRLSDASSDRMLGLAPSPHVCTMFTAPSDAPMLRLASDEFPYVHEVAIEATS